VYHEFSGPEIYNLENDPYEIDNLAGKGAESIRVEKELHTALLNWMERTGDPMLNRILSMAT
jgi:hypothetical protein